MLVTGTALKAATRALASHRYVAYTTTRLMAGGEGGADPAADPGPDPPPKATDEGGDRRGGGAGPPFCSADASPRRASVNRTSSGSLT